AVIRAIDLDRGQLRGGVGRLLRLRQLLRIEHAAPRLEGPAADADVNVAAHAAVLGGALGGFGHGEARKDEAARSLLKSPAIDQLTPAANRNLFLSGALP